jgi:hypothetical protein
LGTLGGNATENVDRESVSGSKSAETLWLADLQDIRAVLLMLHPRIAAPVRDFAIELDDEMFAIDGKLGDGARAKLKSAVETCPFDNVNGVRRVNFEELAMRDTRMRGVAGIVEQTQRIASGRPANAGPIGNARAAAPIIGIENFYSARFPGFFTEHQERQSNHEEWDPFHIHRSASIRDRITNSVMSCEAAL